MTRSAYVQVKCAVVALWSERHQRYAATTGLEASNLTPNSGFAGSSFLGEARVPVLGEFPVQRVERGRAGEPDEVGAVGHVGLAAERFPS
jgi:hypothetical protein